MTPSELIDKQIQEAGGWKGELIAKLRKLIHEADPEIQEEWKWDVGVYVHTGMVCAVSAFKDHIKINFFKGAAVQDPHKLFNNGLNGYQRSATGSIVFFGDDGVVARWHRFAVNISD